MTQNRVYVREENIIKIKKIIKKLQKVSPFVAVTKKQVDLKIRTDYKQLEMSYRTLGRIFEKLVKRGSLVKECYGQYWIPKYKKQCLEITKRQLEIERAARKQAEKDIETVKQEKKEIFDKIKSNNITIKELEADYKTIFEVTKPYLDNLRYCESDQDWDLLTKWFMKMHENKHYQEEAEAWEQEQKDRAEILRREETKS